MLLPLLALTALLNWSFCLIEQSPQSAQFHKLASRLPLEHAVRFGDQLLQPLGFFVGFDLHTLWPQMRSWAISHAIRVSAALDDGYWQIPVRHHAGPIHLVDIQIAAFQ
jgi:hypothetical protein